MPGSDVQERFDGVLRPQDGRRLLAQDLPSVIGECLRRCSRGRLDLLWLISERRGVQLAPGRAAASQSPSFSARWVARGKNAEARLAAVVGRGHAQGMQ
jgi:hypothetical protein